MGVIEEYILDTKTKGVDGDPLSKKKRIESMYSFVTNTRYKESITIKERILASKLITMILEEEST